MKHIGVDIIEIPRIERAVSLWGASFLRRIYTDIEIKLYGGDPSSLAARFAGKEAVVKALSQAGGILCWREIEITTDPSGRPQVRLHGKTRRQARRLNLKELAISLSHSREHAVAFVVAETE